MVLTKLQKEIINLIELKEKLAEHFMKKIKAKDKRNMLPSEYSLILPQISIPFENGTRDLSLLSDIYDLPHEHIEFGLFDSEIDNSKIDIDVEIHTASYVLKINGNIIADLKSFESPQTCFTFIIFIDILLENKNDYKIIYNYGLIPKGEKIPDEIDLKLKSISLIQKIAQAALASCTTDETYEKLCEINNFVKKELKHLYSPMIYMNYCNHYRTIKSMNQ